MRDAMGRALTDAHSAPEQHADAHCKDSRARIGFAADTPRVLFSLSAASARKEWPQPMGSAQMKNA
jgi:hypothetical protein